MRHPRVIIEDSDPDDSFNPVLLIKHIAGALGPRKSAKTRHIVEHGDTSTEVDKQFVDDCINDGTMELFRWYRDGSVLVQIYHWTQ